MQRTSLLRCIQMRRLLQHLATPTISPPQPATRLLSSQSPPATSAHLPYLQYGRQLRSHLCGQVSLVEGEPVEICGWLHSKRFDNRFWLLRDWTGTVQVLLDGVKGGEWDGKAPLESVVRVRGVVRRRPVGQENPKMATGTVEVCAEEVRVLNRAAGRLPFIPSQRQVGEPVRMQFRYLDLRTAPMQRNLRLRSWLTSRMRRFLAELAGFVEVETPYLFRPTPGGAQEFPVVSQHPGHFYALTQSPQQFKQLLMVGGMDRYFQMARCFRDESNNPEKQPEFTQLDLEMSFVGMEDVLRLVEDLVGFSWPDAANLRDVRVPFWRQEETLAPLVIPFPRISYHEAMSIYGTDKPDTRFEWPIRDVDNWAQHHPLFPNLPPSHTVRALVARTAAPHCKTAFKQAMETLIRKEYPGVRLAFLTSKSDGSLSRTSLSRDAAGELGEAVGAFGMEDLVVVCAGEEERCLKALGRLRLETADHVEAAGGKVRREGFAFIWVVDFPLFARSDDGNRWETVHHPFTAPHPEDAHLLHDDGDLSRIRGQHYDLVLNGAEVAGGSIRIEDARLQRHVLHILDIDPAELQHLLAGLDSGCPPHGGIAFGLDRLVCLYAREKSIRQVIAFPKSALGRDLMAGAPCALGQETLDLYHLVVKDAHEDEQSVKRAVQS